jgi:ADP-heptose:LPS heptosyltransferase
MLKKILSENLLNESKYFIEISRVVLSEKEIEKPKNKKSIKDAKKIIVVCTDRIGDTLNTLYFINNLRKNFMNSEITYIIKKFSDDDFFKKIFSVKVNKIYEISYDGKNNILFLDPELEKYLKEEKFDILFDLNPFVDPIIKKINYKTSIGFWRPMMRYFTNEEPLKNDIEFKMKPSIPKSLNNLNLLSILGLKCNLEYEIPDFDINKNFDIDGKKIICVCFESTACNRTLYENKAKEIMNFINSELMEYTIVILGSNINSHGISVKDNEKIINLTGKTSLTEAAYIIKKSDLMLSVDTGMMHLSSYLKIPTIGLFFGSHPELNCPQGLSESIVIHSYFLEDGKIFYNEKCKENIKKRHILTALRLLMKND